MSESYSSDGVHELELLLSFLNDSSIEGICLPTTFFCINILVIIVILNFHFVLKLHFLTLTDFIFFVKHAAKEMLLVFFYLVA